MLIDTLVTLALFLHINACHCWKELPEAIKPCKHDAQLSDCSRKVLEKLRPHLVKGIREFAVPSIDPMFIPVIEIERRNSNIAEYSANMTNLLLTGCKDFNILDIVINLDKLALRLKLEIPHLYVEADGFLDGVVLGFQIQGSGGGAMNYTRVILDFVSSGEQYNYKGNEFVKWKTEHVEINYESFYFAQLHGFLKHPTITELLRLALNRGSRLMVATFRAIIEHSLRWFIVQSVNSVHIMYPKDILYST